MKKKILSILLVGFIIMGLSGCGKEEPEPVETKNEETEEKIEKKEELYVVPDVSGLTESEAKEKLETCDGKFKVEIDYKEDEEIEKGKVIKTLPSAHSERTSNSTIIMYVSSGKEELVMGNYIGKNYKEVKTTLENKGLKVEIIKKDIENAKDDTIIVDQSPEEGKVLNKNQTISLYIPKRLGYLPDFTNGTYTKEDIENFCNEYGISCTFYYNKYSDMKSGTIIDQTPKAGTSTSGLYTIIITIRE